MEQKPSSAVKILGWITIFCLIWGHFFKAMAWPTGALGIIIGSLTFLMFYLPLWFLQARQEKENRPAKLIQLISLLLYTTATLFKTMHWPGGGVLFHGLYLFTTIFLVPYSFYLLFRTGKSSLVKFHTIVIYFLLLTATFSMNFRTVSGSVVNSFAQNNSHIEQLTIKSSAKNQQLYNAFNELDKKEENHFYKKSQKLKLLADSITLYIHSLKTFLISNLENISLAEADSLSITQVSNNTQTDIPFKILIGDENKHNTGRYSGMELKSIMEWYKDSVIKFIESENKEFIISGINLETDNITDENNESVNWINATFLHSPAITVLSTLCRIENEIKNAETLVLSDLLNSASKDISNNLVVKIVDLSQKLETEKKEQKFSLLKKEAELNQIRLDAKNLEIKKGQQATIFYIVGLLACSVMLFFIIRSNFMRKKINSELKIQKNEIETKNKEITDSINYAKRIQQAILPPVDLIYKALIDSFILYKPKDVVSGDFYFFIQRDDYILVGLADCTGHGVPGAFMSMIGNEQLSKIVIEKNISQPAEILNQLHSGIRAVLKQDQIVSDKESRDGMDIILCKIYLTKNKMEYAGAMRPLWIIRHNKLIEIKANKQAIGGLETEFRTLFTNHSVDLEAGDSIYMFTDGYADQFGGERGKKFMLKNFEKLLMEINFLPMKKQEVVMQEKFESWKGNNEQVDDVLVLGFRI